MQLMGQQSGESDVACPEAERAEDDVFGPLHGGCGCAFQSSITAEATRDRRIHFLKNGVPSLQFWVRNLLRRSVYSLGLSNSQPLAKGRCPHPLSIINAVHYE